MNAYTLRPTRWWPRQLAGELVRVIEPCADADADLWSIYRDGVWIADYRVTERALAEQACASLNRNGCIEIKGD